MVATDSIAQSVGLAILLFTVAGATFAWLAWRIGRRWGVPALLAVWVVGALACTAAMAVRIDQQQAALGFTAEQRPQFAPFRTFLPFWLASLGAVSLLIRRRLRAGAARFSATTALGSMAAYIGGALAFFLIYAMLDLSGLLRQ